MKPDWISLTNLWGKGGGSGERIQTALDRFSAKKNRDTLWKQEERWGIGKWDVFKVQFSRSVVSDSLRPHESQHARPPSPSPTPGVHMHTFLIIFFSIVVYPESLFLSSIKYPCIPLINPLPLCPSLKLPWVGGCLLQLKACSQDTTRIYTEAKSLQSCLTLCDLMDCSPPGSPVHGILQARILEWVAMPSSRGSCWPRDRTRVS